MMQGKLSVRDICSIVAVIASLGTAYYEYHERVAEMGLREEQLGKAVGSIVLEECDDEVRLQNFIESLEQTK